LYKVTGGVFVEIHGLRGSLWRKGKNAAKTIEEKDKRVM